jgi:subtilisin family serine protease
LNRRLAIFALVLSLVAPIAFANGGGSRAQRPAYAAIAISGARTPVRILRSSVDPAPARVIVEFFTPPLAALPPSARVLTAHRELVDRLRDDLADIDSKAGESKSVASTIDHDYSLVFSGAAVTTQGTSVAALRLLPYVRRVVEDSRVRGTVEPGIAAVGADRVWSDYGTRGAGVTVAIVDSGVDYLHPALGGGIGSGFKVIGGYDFVNDDNDPIDDNGHGTHVAGIVAASSDDRLGVAPDATLVAFKVLDRELDGFESDVVAAIERCADPDGNPDTSDMVQVVNMSLGGDGNPDDPQSLAVDAASGLGIVFAIAAGNGGSWQSISSPGTAAKAITVGAADATGALAEFSSRGPVPPGYALKPEVVAPGVAILSTWPGGTTATLSGTSMAAPHVAGIAALVRAIHPQWTSAEVKSAIVETARPLGTSVMAAGAGFPGAGRAAAASTLVTPSTVDFGVVDTSTQRWASTRTVLVRNDSGAARSYALHTSGSLFGLSISLNALAFTLQAGETRSVEITGRADNGKLGFPDDGSLSYDGDITIESGGEAVARIPWVAVKGLHFRVNWSGNENVLAIMGAVGGHSSYLTETTETSFETLISPGNYNLSLIALPTDGGSASFVAFENLRADADRQINASRANAPYTLTYRATDEAGRPFDETLEAPAGCTLSRSVVLPGSPAPIVEILDGSSPALRSSPTSGQISVVSGELCVDASRLRVYSIPYEPVRGVSSNVTKTAGGHDLLAQPVDIRVPLGSTGEASIVVESLFRTDGLPLPVGSERVFPWSAPRWEGKLFLGSRPSTVLDFPTRISAVAGGAGDRPDSIVTKLIHRGDDGVACFDSATPSASVYTARPGEPLVFGRGSFIPIVSIVTGDRPVATVEFAGPLGEKIASSTGSISLFTRQGSLISTGRDSVEIADMSTKPLIVARADAQEVLGVAASARATLTTGATLEDPIPPSLTSMILLDGAGMRIIDRTTRGMVPRIRFAASDAADEALQSRVRFRRLGEIPWTDVPTVVAARDLSVDGLGDPPRGTLFEASLGLLASSEGLYELEITVEDRAGNSAVTVLSPAIAVLDVERRRPVRP